MGYNVIKSIRYGIEGLIIAFKNEFAFRIEILIFLIALPIGLYYSENNIEKIILISTMFIVFIVEVINTAIEATVDRISKDHHELSKIAKDLGAAAVLLSLIFTAIVWFLIFYNKIGIYL